MSVLGKVVKTEKRSFYYILMKRQPIFFLVSSSENQSIVVMRKTDADCLVIRLDCRKKLDPSLKI